MTDETDSSQYDNETHMLKVLDVNFKQILLQIRSSEWKGNDI